jgi:hypothetical protein
MQSSSSNNSNNNKSNSYFTELRQYGYYNAWWFVQAFGVQASRGPFTIHG